MKQRKSDEANLWVWLGWQASELEFKNLEAETLIRPDHDGSEGVSNVVNWNISQEINAHTIQHTLFSRHLSTFHLNTYKTK